MHIHDMLTAKQAVRQTDSHILELSATRGAYQRVHLIFLYKKSQTLMFGGLKMIEHYKKILKDSEKRAEVFMKKQVMDNKSENYGGKLDEYNLVQPKSTIYSLTTLISLYLNKDSIYFKNDTVFERIILALDYVERAQREDGTFDLLDCNFYAAPDTAFCVKRLLPAYKLLLKYVDNEKCVIIKDNIHHIMKKAAYGICAGGFHTPNHRWAIASSLMACFNIYGERQFKETALSYLKEGIDGNEYGEYAERSAGNYNRINNDAMILLAEETGDKAYYDYAIRNLKMMFNYIEPDGSIFTNNSTRQDRGKKVYPRDYFFEYLYMAYRTKECDFAAAANKIMEGVYERGANAPDCLDLLMLNPELMEYTPEGCCFPENYKEYYKDSGIVRVRRGNTSYSIIENSSRFLYFQSGTLTAFMKIGVSYFDQREYKIQKLEQTACGYKLYYTAKGWYYKPLADKPDTTDWWKMDHTKREKKLGPDLDIIVSIQEVNNGIEVKVQTEGCDRVPLKIELGFNAGSSVKADGFMCEGTAGNAVTAVSGKVVVSKDADAIEVGPAFATHNFVGGKFGSEGRSVDHFTVFFTDSTNFDHTFTFKGV